MKYQDKAVCVLSSGGFDSAALFGYCLLRYRTIYPLYIACGLRWERAERFWLKRFLTTLHRSMGNQLRPLTIIPVDLQHVYGVHWSTNGKAPPGRKTKDTAVYLPGRNLLLLTHAAIFCEQRGIRDVAFGHLASNPFPDARQEFFRMMERSIQLATRHRVRVLTPFARLSKQEVTQHTRYVPATLTFSCLNPKGLQPCGRCNKCAEYSRIKK